MKKEIRNINGTLYYVYPLNWRCLSISNNSPCIDCKCYGGREGNKILCTENWADRPDPNDNYSL